VNDIPEPRYARDFGASVKAEPAAAFDSDDVMDLKGVADLANWPGMGRSLILNSAYDVNLLKDQAIKNAMAFGDNAQFVKAALFALVDLTTSPMLASRVLLVKTLRVMITSSRGCWLVSLQLDRQRKSASSSLNTKSSLSLTTGATFEYRRFGSAVLDASYQTIEANYGRSAGEACRIKRITNQ
jgi:hypothetical protein